MKDVRGIAKGRPAAIPRLQELLQNPRGDVRLQVVKQLTEIGTERSLDPLIQAARDNDPQVQIGV
jgi:HEAT repeat protein